jgi:hypothetical protein
MQKPDENSTMSLSRKGDCAMDMTERVFAGMAIIGTVGFALCFLLLFG